VDPTRRRPNLTVSLYLATVWEKKLGIVFVVLAVTFCAVLYSLILRNLYQASAQVILLPPLVTVNPADAARQISPQTVERLLANAETARRAIRQLRMARGALAKLPLPKGTPEQQAESLAAMSARDLAGAPGITKEEIALLMNLKPGETEALLACSPEDIATLSIGAVLGALQTSTSVETRMATETVFSPVVLIKAVMRKPQLARAVANAAARVLVDRCREITSDRAQQSSAEMEQQVLKQREVLDSIDQESARLSEIGGNANMIDRDLYWLDRAYGGRMLANPKAADAPETAALREKIAKLQNQRDAARSRVDTRDMLRTVYGIGLRSLLEMQVEVGFTPAARLKKVDMVSPAGPTAARIYPNRKQLTAMVGVITLVVALGGVFVLLLGQRYIPEEPPASASAAGGPQSSGSGWRRTRRGGRGGRFRSRPSGPHDRRDNEPHGPSGSDSARNGSHPPTQNGSREQSGDEKKDNATWIRPD